MFQLIVILHVLACFVLVVAVLLQSGRGGGLASAFGGAGGTEAVFGGRGAATFLSKLTTALGAVFFVTSLFLAITSSHTSMREAAPRENMSSQEPQPFNPETQLLQEAVEPPPVTGEVEGSTAGGQ